MDSKRNTIQQRLILDAVKKLSIHATAEQVYECVAAAYPSISKATVYRNLGQMAQAGELLNIGSFGGAAHYDHNLARHDHFVCEACGSVFDVDSALPSAAELEARLHGFEIRSYNLTFSGLCPACRRPSGEKTPDSQPATR